ncbi:MAG: calcium-translocating P-type ATPase, SERCA-type [Bacilli bacterium]
MQWYEMRSDEVERQIGANFHSGLSEFEVQARRKTHGANELVEQKKRPAWLVFVAQFNDFMVYILLGAMLISMFFGDWIDAIAIIAIVILNGVLGFFQEFRAEKSLKALKALAAPLVNVKREREWHKIPSRELVPGDVVKFGSGDRIGADLRIIEANNLQIEESALTGESVPSEKKQSAITEVDVQLGDQSNMAFMGTLVTSGTGVGVVIGTGMKTAMGRIATLMEDTNEMETPLQRRLQNLGKVLIVVALLLTLFVVGLGVYGGQDLIQMFLAGVSLAVAAIPEGLPAIVTVALSLGVQRLIKRNAIVRKLPSVETLGCTTVICSDKTGTLTENKMMVTHLYTNGRTYNVTGKGYEPEGNFYTRDATISLDRETAVMQLLTYGYLASNADLRLENERFILDGDPTEGALVCAAQKAGIKKSTLDQTFERVKQFPFDSARKMMSVLVRDRFGRQYVIVKGAPDVVLPRCTSVWHDGRTQRMSLRSMSMIEERVDEFTSGALRTIAIAFREVTGENRVQTAEDAESNLVFLGVQGMIDPPRKEVKRAVEECHEAGIKTVMITGDHRNTAEAIARELGILEDSSVVVEGKELDLLTQNELEEVVEDIAVFARVTPEHKLRIVRAFQTKGHVVAMTGDGVNDAPAIKQADIGIAMGITGTDVAKEAASLVLLDDNFTTIKTAIKEGRNIYENIRKFIRYLLASNVGEILVMLFAMMLGLPLPLIPVQILWVNLVTDGLPAMALGMDQPESNLMKVPPRNMKEGIFARGMAWKIFSRGFLIGVITLIAFIITNNMHPNNLEYAQTVAFTTLVFSQLLIVFDCRSERSILFRNPFENKYLVGAVLVSLLLMFVVIYYPPLQSVFHTQAIATREWLLIAGLAGIPTFLLAGISTLDFVKHKKKQVQK